MSKVTYVAMDVHLNSIAAIWGIRNAGKFYARRTMRATRYLVSKERLLIPLVGFRIGPITG
jgi:hypothetical protein